MGGREGLKKRERGMTYSEQDGGMGGPSTKTNYFPFGDSGPFSRWQVGTALLHF